MRPVLEPCDVGILGGGQLARMLAESALRLGLRPIAFADEEDCPASEICVETVVGRISDREKLEAFVSRSTLVTFENEFIDPAPLRAAAADPRSKFFPSLEAIEILQDKVRQKELLKKLKIPSSPFVTLKGDDPSSEIRDAAAKLKGALVLKWGRQGYDGKGVKFVDPTRTGDLEQAEKFFRQAQSKGIPVFAEARVDFVRELAIIGCVSRGGECVSYPLVISEQQNGVCKQVTGPAIRLGVSTRLQEDALKAVAEIARESGLTGAFGIEFFESRSGQLLVNEIAPRVHNTGHYTQNAFPVSQFENHWRALLNLPLFDPLASGPIPFFAMRNILGPAGAGGSPVVPVPGPRTQLHWYAKKDIRPGRKLGHLNGIADSAEALSTLLKELEMCEKTWASSVNGTERKAE